MTVTDNIAKGMLIPHVYKRLV